MASPVLLGCDFTSRATRLKPIVVASGNLHGKVLRLSALQFAVDDAGFLALLNSAPDWVGAFDLPFGLPRELVTQLGWPLQWHACLKHYQTLTRAEIRSTFSAFCAQRPVGGKFAHRATDGPAASSPSMKWVNPPVAYMLHAGVPLLLQAGASFPGIFEPDAPAASEPSRIALEGYPGLLAREILGRASYKSDDRHKQTSERLIARKEIIEALEQGRTRLGLRLQLSNAQRDTLAGDPAGDSLDATLCLMQAAWARMQFENGDRRYGLPPHMDPLEGWIVTAPWPQT